MKKLFVGVLVCLFMTAASKPVYSEVNGPYSFGFNMNFPAAVGATADVLKDGIGFAMDVGYRPETSPLGIRLDVSYASWELTSDVLNQINFADSGWATVWGFDLSAVLTPPNANKVRPYIQAGPGFYYESAEASRFQGGGGYVCDPWFGCWPVSNSETVADWSTWRMGWVGGAGLNFEFDGGGAFFLQMQYHLINNTRQDTEFVPMALGYRHTF